MEEKQIYDLEIFKSISFKFTCLNGISLYIKNSQIEDEYGALKDILLIDPLRDEFYFTCHEEVLAFCETVVSLSENIFKNN